MVHHGNLVAEDINRVEILDSEPRTVHAAKKSILKSVQVVTMTRCSSHQTQNT